MRRTQVWAALGACAALHAAPAAAQNPAGIVIHMTEADFSQGCALVDDATLECQVVATNGDASTNQFAWVIAYGWDTIPGWGGPDVGLSGAAFGVTYPPQTTVLNWIGCADFEIPLEDKLIGDWPDSDTGIAVAFSDAGGYNPDSRFATLGFLHLQAGSSGRLAIVRHAAAQVDAVQFVSSNDDTFDLPQTGFSSADVGGDAPENGLRTCEGVVPTLETSWGRVKSIF